MSAHHNLSRRSVSLSVYFTFCACAWHFFVFAHKHFFAHVYTMLSIAVWMPFWCLHISVWVCVFVRLCASFSEFACGEMSSHQFRKHIIKLQSVTHSRTLALFCISDTLIDAHLLRSLNFTLYSNIFSYDFMVRV